MKQKITKIKEKHGKNWKWRATFFVLIITMLVLMDLVNTFEDRNIRIVLMSMLGIGLIMCIRLLGSSFTRKVFNFVDVRQKIVDIVLGNLVGTIFLLVIIFALIFVIEIPLNFINEFTFGVNELSIRFISVLIVTISIIYFGEEIVKYSTNIIELEEGKEIEGNVNNVLRKLKLRQKMYILIAIVYFIYSIEQLNGEAIINFSWWRSFFPIVQNVAITFIGIDAFLQYKIRKRKK